MLRSIIALLFIVHSLGFSAGSTAAAPSPYDGYNPSAYSTVLALAVQPDGKTLVGGAFTSIGGSSQKFLARLNADGSADAAFNPGIPNSAVQCIAIQPDGKILIGGYFDHVQGTEYNRIARLNADGSLDTGFNPGAGASDTVRSIAVQADGKILVAGNFATFNGAPCSYLVRLTATGAIDTGFNNAAGPNNRVARVTIQTDGKILIAGDFTKVNGANRLNVARLNANGLPDTGFLPAVEPTDATTSINDVVQQLDGKILVGGSNIKGIGGSRACILRLNANGSLDSSFEKGSGVGSAVNDIDIQADGRILLCGEFTTLDGATHPHIGRLNPDGSLDAHVAANAGTDYAVYAIVHQPDGNIVIGGQFQAVNGVVRKYIARLNQHDMLAEKNFESSGTDGTVRAFSLQSDGKLIVGGQFTTMNGSSLSRIARLDANGNLDTSFIPGTGASSSVYTTAIQRDGKILIGGSFTQYNGTNRSRIARLNTNGSLDTSFNPVANGQLSAIAVQPNGNIMLGGWFTSVYGTDRNYLARVTADGKLDATFTPGTGPNNNVYSIVLQTGGRMLISGQFTSYNGVERNYIARLFSDGKLDTYFNPAVINYFVQCMAVQLDGKIVIGGGFTSVGGASRNYIARLNADGSLDQSFNPGTGMNNWVGSIQVQANGKILVGGDFTTVNGVARKYFARLNADGSLDTTYDPGTGADAAVTALMLLPDGKTMLGGKFTTVCGVARNRLARVTNPDPAVQSVSIEDAGQKAVWKMGGSFPVPDVVTFDSSTTGSTYTPLGYGMNVNPVAGVGFSLGYQTIPVGSFRYIRANGWFGGGQYHGSGSPISSVAYARANTAFYKLVYIAGRNGTIDGKTSVTQTVEFGHDGQPVTAIPNPGYYFSQWEDEGGGNPRIEQNVKRDLTARALFQQITHKLYITATNGTVEKSPSYVNFPHGTTVTLTAIPDPGCYFTGWTGQVAAAHKMDNPLRIVMDSSKTLSTIFFANTPNAPTNPRAKSITKNSITWTWKDNCSFETGYKVYYWATPSPGNKITSTTAANTTSFVAKNLSPNTEHAFYAAAVNHNVDNVMNSVYTTYTLANTPLPPAVSNITSVTLRVRIASSNGNPAYTPLAIYCLNRGKYVQADGKLGSTAVWQTDAKWNALAAVKGLTPDTFYEIAVKAKNWSGVQTGFGQSTLATTLPRLRNAASDWQLYR